MKNLADSSENESNCSCIMCKRQPPSLRNMVRHIFGTLNFELTVFTTFEQYVSVVNSDQVHFEQLLPPEFPLIRIRYFYKSFEFKFHRNCPGEASRHGRISLNFKDISDAVLALSDESKKDTFWCKTCNRGLFFPNTCRLHPY